MAAYLFRSSAVPRTAWRFVTLLRDTSGPRDLGVAVALTLAGSLAEGAGLLMLVPVLRLIGVGGQSPPGAGAMIVALGLYLALVAAGAGVVALRNIHVAAGRIAFVDKLRGDLHDALLRVSWPGFQRLRGAELLHAILGETGRLGACHAQFMTLLATVATVPFLLAVALFLSPGLTLLTLLIGGAAMLMLHRIGRSGFGVGTQLGQAATAMTADLSDDLAGLRTLKALGVERSRAARLAGRFAHLRVLQMRHARMQAIEHAALLCAAALVTCVAVLAATLWLRLSVANALVIIMAFARLTQRGLGGMRTWRQLEANLPAIHAYDMLIAQLRADAEPDAPDAPAAAPVFSTSLVFDNVCLHAPDGRLVLSDMRLSLPYGAVMVVTGPSGAGKSTLADLASGLTHPSGGLIRVDGVALTRAMLPAWRRQVAVVPQDPFLFHDSVRANLLLAAPDADDASLWSALETAGAAAFVRALPLQLDAPVGDRGSSLSGGERQRLAIARALLRKPRLLILDEATSALDHDAEAHVLETLERLRGQVTIIAITHRPMAHRTADVVLKLEAPTVA